MANPDIQLCDLASLNWVSHRVPNSPAELYGHVQSTMPYVGRVYTHTRTHIYIYNIYIYMYTHLYLYTHIFMYQHMQSNPTPILPQNQSSCFSRQSPEVYVTGYGDLPLKKRVFAKAMFNFQKVLKNWESYEPKLTKDWGFSTQIILQRSPSQGFGNPGLNLIVQFCHPGSYACNHN